MITRKMHKAEQTSVHGICRFHNGFDTMHRETLWKILREIGCPDLFFYLIASQHKVMKASVSLKGELSKPFDVQNGVK